MTSSPVERPTGLRERKKARTRDAIQQHALKLFDANGYAETTTEQIAEAAEVSPSTFFRYFPTKEDTVLYDRVDSLLIESFLDQPEAHSALRALRCALRETFGQMSVEEAAVEASRQRLFYNVPALRSRLMERLVDTMSLVSDAVATRVGVDRNDPRVRVFTGATFGVIMAAIYNRPEAPPADEPPATMSEQLVAAIDSDLQVLEGGLPFETADDH